MSAQAFVRQSAIVAAQPPAAPKRVLVVGGSGGVGQLVVRVLNNDPRVSSVTAVVRSPKNTKFWADEGQSSDKIRVVVVPDFDNLRDHEAAFAGHDVFISCLGIYTHQAKSEEHFMSVEHDYNKAIAEGAKKGGATSFAYLSGAGVVKPHEFRFYTPMFSRVKGRAEHMLETTFERGISARPAGIFKRPGGDGVLGGVFGAIIDAGWLNWAANTSLGIDAIQIAKAMVQGSVIAPAPAAAVENVGLKTLSSLYDDDLAKYQLKQKA